MLSGVIDAQCGRWILCDFRTLTVVTVIVDMLIVKAAL